MINDLRVAYLKDIQDSIDVHLQWSVRIWCVRLPSKQTEGETSGVTKPITNQHVQLVWHAAAFKCESNQWETTDWSMYYVVYWSQTGPFMHLTAARPIELEISTFKWELQILYQLDFEIIVSNYIQT
jgi:hypothetical protein